MCEKVGWSCIFKKFSKYLMNLSLSISRSPIYKYIERRFRDSTTECVLNEQRRDQIKQ